jgi:hypothetical protein
VSLCRALVQCRGLLRARARRKRCSLQGASLRGSQRRGCWCQWLPSASGLFRLSAISGRARSRTLPLVEQAPLDRPPGPVGGWVGPRVAAEGSLRPPREPGLCAGDQAEAGDRPGGFGSRNAGRCCVCESPEGQRTGKGGALEWPHVSLKGPVQSESGRAHVPIARRSTAQQL